MYNGGSSLCSPVGALPVVPGFVQEFVSSLRALDFPTDIVASGSEMHELDKYTDPGSANMEESPGSNVNPSRAVEDVSAEAESTGMFSMLKSPGEDVSVATMDSSFTGSMASRAKRFGLYKSSGAGVESTLGSIARKERDTQMNDDMMRTRKFKESDVMEIRPIQKGLICCTCIYMSTSKHAVRYSYDLEKNPMERVIRLKNEKSRMVCKRYVFDV